MCVWYNITKRQRLMLLILGRHLMKEEEEEEEVELEPLNNCMASSSGSKDSPRYIKEIK